MKVEELEFENYKETIAEAIANKEEAFFYSIIPQNIIYKGKGEIDEEFARKSGYDIYNSIDFGGGIVATKGDIVLVIIKQEGWKVGEQIIEQVKEILQEKGISAEIDGNDILIANKYKCASHSSTHIGNRAVYTGVQICFHADPDIIKRICKKESKKIPIGLSNFGIDNTELLVRIKEIVCH